MKLSELQQAIEEIITEILSESDTDETRGTVLMPRSTSPQNIKKYTDQNIDVEVREVKDEDDDSPAEKEPTKSELKKIDKELGSKNKKKDEIISAYKKIAGDIKEKAKAANSGDKEAKAWIDKYQSIIKAYKKLQKVG